MNLVYLAVITQRIAVMGVFTPSHIGFNMENIEFGKVFDVPRLSKLIGLPVVEWHEVKDKNSTEIDQLGCWDVWESVQTDEHLPRKSRVPGIVGIGGTLLQIPCCNSISMRYTLDISYTKTPAWVKILPNFLHDRHSSFFSLAALGFPEMRTEALRATELVVHESPINRVRLPPDEQLLCYDYLYYTATNFVRHLSCLVLLHTDMFYIYI